MLRKKRFSFPIHNHSKSPGEPRQMQLFATCYPFYLIVSHAGSHKNGDVQARAVFLWPLFFKLPRFGHVIFKFAVTSLCAQIDYQQCPFQCVLVQASQIQNSSPEKVRQNHRLDLSSRPMKNSTVFHALHI